MKSDKQFFRLRILRKMKVDCSGIVIGRIVVRCGGNGT